jgi:hypothetical protein
MQGADLHEVPDFGDHQPAGILALLDFARGLDGHVAKTSSAISRTSLGLEEDLVANTD